MAKDKRKEHSHSTIILSPLSNATAANTKVLNEDHEPMQLDSANHQDTSSTATRSQSASAAIEIAWAHVTHEDHEPERTSSLTTTDPQQSGSVNNAASSAADEYRQRLATVNGITIPSKVAPGEQPIRPAGLQPRPSNFFCPICTTGYSKKLEVRSHFVACVGRNGNPTGAHWDDGPQPQPSTTIIHQPLNRIQKMHKRLNAVNGVFSPSKLPCGTLPVPHTSKAWAGIPLNFLCPVCRGPFGRKSHVKEHFPKCVETYGNPRGLTWDHGL